jgi:hypothetical protein
MARLRAVAPPGMEEMTQQLKGMFQQLSGGGSTILATRHPPPRCK